MVIQHHPGKQVHNVTKEVKALRDEVSIQNFIMLLKGYPWWWRGGAQAGPHQKSD